MPCQATCRAAADQKADLTKCWERDPSDALAGAAVSQEK